MKEVSTNCQVENKPKKGKQNVLKITKLFFYKKVCENVFSFKPRTFVQECLIESQCDENFDLLLIYKTAQHLKFKRSFVIGLNTSRRSKYPSDWLFVRLLYKSTLVCKLEVLGFIHFLSNFLPALCSCLPKQYW